MGRIAYSTRMEDLLDLDIRRVIRDVGSLDGVSPFVWQWFRREQLRAVVLIQPVRGGIQLTQAFGDQSSTYVRVLTSPCHFGGVRAWWSCPKCSSRVAILYAGKRFACRKCHELTYTSQKASQHDRTIAMAERIRTRLRWQPGIVNGTGPKPKGMHWSTYRALVKMHNDRVGQAMYALSTLRMFRQKFE